MKLLSIVLVCVLLSACNACRAEKPVHEATGTLPEFPKIDVSDADRFLNDLMLSPLWKVEKERDGSYIAKARSIVPENAFEEHGREFLFELMARTDKVLPKDYRIRDEYLDGWRTFSTFQILVVFQKPNLTSMALGQSGQKTALRVYEPYGSDIGPNSTSDLAIKLSSKHEIYVILGEQGQDSARATTFSKVLPALTEVADIAASPKTYRTEDRYAAFYKLFFAWPLKDQEIRRLPGDQARDTFYGYFRAKPGTSYSGVNIRICHPIYCPDEGTRKSSRLRKAEYLGVPYQDNDIVFFEIEDNAVYLSGDADQRFGIFTGKESFDGIIEVLNDKEAVLLRTVDKFRGWQR